MKDEKYIVCQWCLGKCPMFHSRIFSSQEQAIHYIEQEKLVGRATIFKIKEIDL